MGMGSSTSLGIGVTSEATYSSGSIIQGVVYLGAGKDVDATHLQIALVGQERTQVKYTQTKGHGKDKTRETKIARASNIFFCQRWNLVEFKDNKCMAGQYEYPFSFTVPTISLPPTFSEGGNGSYCRVAYTLEARLHKPGWFKWDNTASREVKVRSVCPATKAVEPKMIEDDIPIKFCCCFSKGNMKLAASVNKDSFVTGEDLEILYEAVNSSTAQVNSISVGLEEHVYWKAGRHASQRICNQQESLSGEKLNNDPKTISLEEDPYKMVVQSSFRDSFCGTLMSCTHAIKITLNTGFGITNPTVRVPVRLYDKFVGEGPEGEVDDGDNGDFEDDNDNSPPLEAGATEVPAGWAATTAVLVNLDDVQVVDNIDPNLPVVIGAPVLMDV